ncbi:MAG: hypothetical protein AAF750_02555 [Planctomycetota bacterium]
MKRRWASITAVFIGCVALTVTLLAIYVVPPPQPPPSPQTQTHIELDIHGFKLGWQSKSQSAQQQPPAPQPFLTQQKVQYAGYATGGLSIVFALLGWVRREGFWLGFLAVSLATAAIAWYVFVVVLFLLGLSGGIFLFPIDRWSRPNQRLQLTGDARDK